mgnify:CR=1 FL=1
MVTINEAKITSSPPDHPRLDGKALEGLRALEELARTMEPETELPGTVQLIVGAGLWSAPFTLNRAGIAGGILV